jgi:hypothetical protein
VSAWGAQVRARRYAEPFLALEKRFRTPACPVVGDLPDSRRNPACPGRPREALHMVNAEVRNHVLSGALLARTRDLVCHGHPDELARFSPRPIVPLRSIRSDGGYEKGKGTLLQRRQIGKAASVPFSKSERTPLSPSGCAMMAVHPRWEGRPHAFGVDLQPAGTRAAGRGHRAIAC